MAGRTRTKIIELQWTCSGCGHTNPGPSKTCTTCGTPKGQTTPFQRPTQEHTVTAPAKIKAAYAGPDWYCSFCQAPNVASKSICGQCGASRETTKPAYSSRQTTSTRAENPNPVATDRGSFGFRRTTPSSLVDQVLGLSGSMIAIIGGILIILLLGIVLFPHNKLMTVEGFGWERKTSVETIQTFTNGGWSVPADAHVIGSEQRQKDTLQVACGSHLEDRQTNCREVGTGRYVECGFRDLGNGYGEIKECEVTETRCDVVKVSVTDYCDQPIYATWYTYQTQDWAFDHWEITNGSSRNAYWPSVSEGRTGNQTESYWLKLQTDDGKPITYRCSYEQWNQYDTGQEVDASTNLLGMVYSIH